MPMYEYSCRVCGHRFEMIRPARERNESASCPECEADGAVLALSVPGMVGAATPRSSTGEGPPAMGGCCGGMCQA